MPAPLSILEATYGSDDSGIEVTAVLQALVRDGRLSFVVSNSLFSDPCPNQLKRLRLTYQLSGDDRRYTEEVTEHQIVGLPDTGA